MTEFLFKLRCFFIFVHIGNIKNECPVQKLNQGGCTSGAPCAPGSCIDESTCLNANGVKCNANMSRRSLADL